MVQSALEYSSVFLFLAVRFSLAALLMVAFRPGILRKLKSEEMLAGAAIGFFMFGGYAFQTLGLLYTTPAKSGFLTGSSVVMVPLLLTIFWRRHFLPWIYVGALAAAAGLYYLTVPVHGFCELNRGDLLTIVAAALFAVHIILIGQYTRKHSVAALSVLQVAACGSLAWLAAGVVGATGWETPQFTWRWELLLAVATCAIFATAMAFTVQTWAQQYTSAAHTAILFTLEPVFAALTSYVVIGERLSPRARLGALLVLTGIFLAELLGTPTAAESPEPTPAA